jgi:two-component system, sensor histidine kinase PdtaS
VTSPPNAPRADRFAALPTGTKMLLILGLALLPLGVVAIWNSVTTARMSRLNDETEARSVLSLSAQRLSSAIARSTVIVRVASDLARNPENPNPMAACDRAAAELGGGNLLPLRFAIYGPGARMICATRGFAAPPPSEPLQRSSGNLTARLEPEGDWLRIGLFDDSGQAQGQIEIPRSAIAPLVRLEGLSGRHELELAGQGGQMALSEPLASGPLVRDLFLSEPLLDDRLQLRFHATAAPLSVGEMALILLPILLWALAALVGWFVIQRLLVRPLTRMQRAIAAYQPGQRDFRLPEARSPAHEINDLGAAFEQVTRTVARHEQELEAAVERQTRLVREVHHRVKNNLQVVASLLNLHSRGSANADVAAAYASIQRRVDALAVVHRNHYAELEVNRGVALKALISELGASLRASAPAGATPLQIRLALEPHYSSQDVAVSVAFLITEVVEYAMLCGGSFVAIALEKVEAGRARLTFESESLTSDATCDAVVQERFDRILTGLSRQLRSPLDKDIEQGSYSLTIATLSEDE